MLVASSNPLMDIEIVPYTFKCTLDCVRWHEQDEMAMVEHLCTTLQMCVKVSFYVSLYLFEILIFVSSD